jgi:curved DNA-binding protein CbpA
VNSDRDVDFDLYSELEVSPRASTETIQAAYRSLAKRYHPDIVGSSPAALAKIKRLNVAHEVLSDPRRRREYDRNGRTTRGVTSSQQSRGTPSPRNAKPRRPPQSPPRARPTASTKPPQPNPPDPKPDPFGPKTTAIEALLRRCGTISEADLRRVGVCSASWNPKRVAVARSAAETAAQQSSRSPTWLAAREAVRAAFTAQWRLDDVTRGPMVAAADAAGSIIVEDLLDPQTLSVLQGPWMMRTEPTSIRRKILAGGIGIVALALAGVVLLPGMLVPTQVRLEDAVAKLVARQPSPDIDNAHQLLGELRTPFIPAAVVLRADGLELEPLPSSALGTWRATGSIVAVNGPTEVGRWPMTLDLAPTGSGTFHGTLQSVPVDLLAFYTCCATPDDARRLAATVASVAPEWAGATLLRTTQAPVPAPSGLAPVETPTKDLLIGATTVVSAARPGMDTVYQLGMPSGPPITLLTQSVSVPTPAQVLVGSRDPKELQAAAAASIDMLLKAQRRGDVSRARSLLSAEGRTLQASGLKLVQFPHPAADSLAVSGHAGAWVASSGSSTLRSSDGASWRLDFGDRLLARVGPASVTLRSFDSMSAWLVKFPVTVTVKLVSATLTPSKLQLRFAWQYGPDPDFRNDSIEFTDYPLVIKALKVGGRSVSLDQPIQFGLLGNTGISGWPADTYRQSAVVELPAPGAYLTPLTITIQAVNPTDEMLGSAPLRTLTKNLVVK